MVAAHHNSPNHHLASNALMSLLREGGQWDEIDDEILRKGHKQSKAFEGDYSKEEWSRDSPAQTPKAVSVACCLGLMLA